MKKKSIILVAIFLSLHVMSQDKVQDSILYATAYEYIKSDSVGKQYNLLPSDTLIGTYYMWFFQDARINSNNEELITLTDVDYSYVPSSITQRRDESALFMKMQRYDEKDVPEDRKFILDKLLPFEPQNDKETLNLYFSEIIHKEFFAQHRGRIYYFIFNTDNSVKKMFAITISD